MIGSAPPSGRPLSDGSRQICLDPSKHSWTSALILSLPIWLAGALLLAGLRAWTALRLPLQGLPAARLPSAGAPPADVASPQAGAMILAQGFTPQVERWGEHIRVWSQQSGLPANLIATVMQVESCGDPHALSPAGALGLFQVMPFHFRSGDDPTNPDTNAARGLAYLASALELSNGHLDLALAGYNGGHSQITRPPAEWPAQTQRYVRWATGILDGVHLPSSDNPGLQAWLAAGGSRLCEEASRHEAGSTARTNPLPH